MNYALIAVALLAAVLAGIYMFSNGLSKLLGYPKVTLVPASNRLTHEKNRGIEVDPQGNFTVVMEDTTRIKTGISIWNYAFWKRQNKHVKIQTPACTLGIDVTEELYFYYLDAKLTTSTMKELKAAWGNNWKLW